MDNLNLVITFITEIGVLIGFLTPIYKDIKKVRNGQKCQLRSDMLTIYYHNREAKKIRQYELENFIALYEAYKALGGNSFIDKIYEEVMGWEVIT